jgi:hypothetical protein
MQVPSYQTAWCHKWEDHTSIFTPTRISNSILNCIPLLMIQQRRIPHYVLCISKGKKGKGNMPRRPIRLWDITAPTFSQNRLTDVGEVAGLMHWPLFSSKNIPGTHFCYGQSWPHSHSKHARMKSTEKLHDLTRNRTHNFPACSTVPQLTVPHYMILNFSICKTILLSLN